MFAPTKWGDIFCDLMWLKIILNVEKSGLFTIKKMDKFGCLEYNEILKRLYFGEVPLYTQKRLFRADIRPYGTHT